MKNSQVELYAPFSFKIMDGSYPSMRLSGSGTITTSSLLGNGHLSYVSQSLLEVSFPENPLGSWDVTLVFFPVRNLKRVPGILGKLGLRTPNAHHAITFGLDIRRSPVAGEVVFPQGMAYVINGECIALCNTQMVFPGPVWAVGFR